MRDDQQRIRSHGRPTREEGDDPEVERKETRAAAHVVLKTLFTMLLGGSSMVIVLR